VRLDDNSARVRWFVNVGSEPFSVPTAPRRAKTGPLHAHPGSLGSLAMVGREVVGLWRSNAR